MTIKRPSPFQVTTSQLQQHSMPTFKRARLNNPVVAGSHETCTCKASSNTASLPTTIVTPLLSSNIHLSNPFRQVSSTEDLDLSSLAPLERAVTLEEPYSDEINTSAFSKPALTLRMRPAFGVNPFTEQAFEDKQQTGCENDDMIRHSRIQLFPPRMAMDTWSQHDFVLETPRAASSSFFELRSPPKIRHRKSEPIVCDTPVTDQLKLPVFT
jgi:hypothetical protein